MTSKNSFGSRATLTVDGKTYTIFRLAALDQSSGGRVAKLPFSLKILLENLLRNEDEAFVKKADIDAMAKEDMVIILHDHRDCLEVRLMPREEGEKLAREHGGMPA